MTPLLKAADRLSFACSRLAMVMILGLIFSMLYEVVARYAFNAPTIWSYDVSYMLNGSLFILGAGWTLANNNHVRIDFLSGRLPVPLQHAGNLVFYILLFLPALGLACARLGIGRIPEETDPPVALAPLHLPALVAHAASLVRPSLKAAS